QLHGELVAGPGVLEVCGGRHEQLPRDDLVAMPFVVGELLQIVDCPTPCRGGLRHRVCSLSRGRSARESTAGSIRRSGPVACMRTAPLGAFSTVVLKYTVGMAIGECTLSEFLQHSGRVLAALAEGGLVLRRRDGEDLVVMTRGQHAALNTVLRTFVAVQQ